MATDGIFFQFMVILVVSSCAKVVKDSSADLCATRSVSQRFCYDNDGEYNLTRCNAQLVRQFLETLQNELLHKLNEHVNATFHFQVDQSEANRLNHLKKSVEFSLWFSGQRAEAWKFNASYYDESTREQLKILETSADLCDEEDINMLAQLNARMTNVYSSVTVSFPKPIGDLSGEQDFNKALRETDDFDTLSEIWTSWYNASGVPLRADFHDRLLLRNKAAQTNGWKDAGFFEWYSDVQDPNFDSKVLALLNDVLPLYKQLHAYVRFKLFNSAAYADRFRGNAEHPIPISILGNLWGQEWSAVSGKVKPYPEYADVDVSQQLVEQDYSPLKMFRTSEAFLVSLGLPKMTEAFWQRSVLVRPNDTDRIVNCHGTAWDLATEDDYRISMCTQVTYDSFRVVHHEMGHVAYYMAYRHLPILFRSGANQGFHEAIGDTITLSVMTPQHLHSVGLLDAIPTDFQFDINYLMTTALQILPLLPFALTVDVWRWRTFNQSIDQSVYNHEWWKLRSFYGGLVPPTDRNNEAFFDPGAKFHVANDVAYIRYFTSHLLQFQFYEAMCIASGYSGPLHRCDFYQSAAAGQKLKKMLEVGASRPWQDTLEEMTGVREISVNSLLNYFEPLEKWLLQFNCEHHVIVGWDDNAKMQCP